jgi:hypothetical protein
MMAGPLVLGLGIAWGIAPEKIEPIFTGFIPKVISNPGEAILCGTMMLAVLAFWPWKRDNRIYFRDVKEECYDYSKRSNLCIIEFCECCEANCPKMKEREECLKS